MTNLKVLKKETITEFIINEESSVASPIREEGGSRGQVPTKIAADLMFDGNTNMYDSPKEEEDNEGKGTHCCSTHIF